MPGQTPARSAPVPMTGDLIEWATRGVRSSAAGGVGSGWQAPPRVPKVRLMSRRPLSRFNPVQPGAAGMKLAATGDMQLEARVQDITATQGNVNVKANDDVCLHGERVKVNC